MILTQLSKRPFWFQMLVVGFAALGATCFAGMGFFLWLNVADRKPLPRSAPVASQAPQQQAPAQNQEPGPASNPAPAGASTQAEVPTASPGQQTSEDARQYDIKIAYYEKVADLWNSFIKSNMEAYRKGAELGSDKIKESMNEAMKKAEHAVNMHSCMKDQKAHGAAFYQGKATCEAAFPSS